MLDPIAIQPSDNRIRILLTFDVRAAGSKKP
jgi:hypothetical protein